MNAADAPDSNADLTRSLMPGNTRAFSAAWLMVCPRLGACASTPAAQPMRMTLPAAGLLKLSREISFRVLPSAAIRVILARCTAGKGLTNDP